MWILALIFIAFVAIFLSYWNSPATKGWRGEMKIRQILGKTQEGRRYVINDLTIPLENGKSCQIDHILIDKNGVLVIETKNYAGRIYGSENQQEWTQVLAYGKVKNRFYNPVRQNKTHLYHISNVIGKEIPLRKAVVFVQGNIAYISAPDVYSINGLKELIGVSNVMELSSKAQKEIYEKLLAIKEEGVVSKQQHLQNIATTQKQIAQNICPRCGGTLVQRHGKYGDFMGCSNYPNCKFIKR